ncbi:MAG: METTL5 family protein [Flavobacteriales bacterium]|jgi:putative methylase|nr:METTL5 family protein [Flavobacteriales bacterium]|tara:strand:- start:1524 stop:2180 length:657 start_codon:yes stop_codon:yes gene_type:complete
MAKSESSNRGRIGSKKALAVLLSGLEGFKGPKVRVEQYATDAEVAAEVLWQAYMKGDIGKVSIDLGCGPGILGIGMLALNAQKVYFVDFDSKVLEVAKKNLAKMESEGYAAGEAIFRCQDVNDFKEKADLVVQNPPFGVKIKHMDKIFLKKAFEIGKVVYSFHKSESKRFVKAFSDDNGFRVTNILDFQFPLKATQSYHNHGIKRINVSCFRIEKKGF